jgi:tRNA threonylcarbamoyladenosine biosynthesis protein TsaB
LIADVLDEAILAPGDLAAVVVGVGPAPYTGLRIGLATGRALGLALGIPVWGVGSLEALAADAVARLSPPPGTRLLAAADARRREIYWAAYRVGPEGEAVPEGGPAVGPAASAPAADVVVGGAVSVYPDVLPTMPAAPLRVDPAVLAGLGVARAAMGAVQPMAPIYLRRPDVAPPSPRKRVTR